MKILECVLCFFLAGGLTMAENRKSLGGSNYSAEDWDGDGISNDDEAMYGSYPWNAYSDSDEKPDGEDGWPIDGDLFPPRVVEGSYAIIPISDLIPDCFWPLSIGSDGSILYWKNTGEIAVWKNGSDTKVFKHVPRLYDASMSDDGGNFIERYITGSNGPMDDNLKKFEDPEGLETPNGEQSAPLAINNHGQAIGWGQYNSYDTRNTRSIKSACLFWDKDEEPVTIGETFLTTAPRGRDSTSNVPDLFFPQTLNNQGQAVGAWAKENESTLGETAKLDGGAASMASGKLTKLPGGINAFGMDINDVPDPWICGSDEKAAFWAKVGGTWKKKEAYTIPAASSHLMNNSTKSTIALRCFPGIGSFATGSRDQWRNSSVSPKHP